MANKKKINEMSSAGGAVSQGHAGNFFRVRRKRRSKNPNAPFGPAGYGVIFPKKKGPRKGKDVKDFKNGKAVSAETKSEQILRESIRNLIFLNRVKYHEQQALREMQEQKLRKVIRYLISESDNAVAKNLDTTGQTAAYKWLQKIEKTTFENSFKALVTSRRQRRAFKKIYLTGVKIYLDSLDQKYFILNPGKNPTQQSMVGQQPVNPAAAGAAAAPGPLAEQEEVHAAAEPVAKALQSSNDSIQDQAITSAVSAAGFGNIEQTEDYEDIRSAVNMAGECLKQDLAQLDDLYFDLSLTNFTTQKGRQTNDRQDFRLFLIGDKGSIGNLQINFNKYNRANPITNVFPGDIPPEEGEASDVPVLDVPNGQAPTPPPPPQQDIPPLEPNSGLEQPPEEGEETPEEEENL